MLERDDIVQITDKDHHWFPCLIIVSEVKSWGVQGYMTILKDNSGDRGNAYIRLAEGTYEHVGKAAIVVGREP